MKEKFGENYICDSCGRIVRCVTMVNGMDFCAKCYEETYGKQWEIKELKQQLAEKDKEIEELEDQCEIWHKLFFEKMETQIVGVTNEKLKEIRHQVCEEIREIFGRQKIYHFDTNFLSEVLDKVEGENK